jgi:cytidyltransferase-like protein
MNFVKLYEEFILIETQAGGKVVLFPGRFMPVHNGHIDAFQRASKAFNGIQVIPIQIAKEGPDSPFPKTLLDKIGQAISIEYKNLIADWVVYPDNLKTVIPQMAKLVIGKGFNPVGLGCGADRYNSYKTQVDYLLSPRSDVKVEEFSIKSIMDRDQDGPSGTKVRETLKTGSQQDFEKLVPRSVWPFYAELKSYIK